MTSVKKFWNLTEKNRKLLRDFSGLAKKSLIIVTLILINTMNIKLDHSTPCHLTSFFALLMKEGISANQIVLGIVQLATQTHELDGMMASTDCLRLLLVLMPAKTCAKGVSEYISSLAVEGVTTLMLLDALSLACYLCGQLDEANLVHLTYKRLQADAIISQMLRD